MTELYGKSVYTVVYNAGLLGIYETRKKALIEASIYKTNGYKGIKIECWTIY